MLKMQICHFEEKKHEVSLQHKFYDSWYTTKGKAVIEERRKMKLEGKTESLNSLSD